VGTGRATASFAIFAIVLGLSALVFAAPANAEIPPEWLGARVSEVRVVGEQAGRIDERSLGVPVGAQLTRTLVRNAIVRLSEQGLWADIQIDAQKVPDGVALLVHLTPRLLALRVEIEGNSALEDRELLRVLALREGSELDRAWFPEWQKKLLESYHERGYDHPQITISTLDTDDPAKKVLRVKIDEGKPTRIRKVRFEGDALPRRKGLHRVLGFEAGDTADLVAIAEGLHRTELLLRSVGYYSAEFGEPRVERSDHEADVIIPSHVGPVYEVHFHDRGPLSQSELFLALSLGEERLSGDADLKALEQKLVELYQKYGFREPKVRVTGREELRVFTSDVTHERYEEPTMVLDVSIDTGIQTAVDRVEFPGAKHFSDKLLRDQVYSYLEEDLPGSSVRRPVDSEVVDSLGLGGGGKAQAAREVPKPMLLNPHRLYHAGTYEQALEHLRELYRGDGYLQVSVGPVSLEPLPAVGEGHVVAVIPVQEGPRTFVFDVRIQGNRTIASRALLHEAALTIDAPFSHVKLEEARLRLVNAYQKRGYYYARVEPLVRMSADGTRAEILFNVEEGYVVRVGRIEVRGAERSRSSMILNRVRMKTGDIYQPDAARSTQDALLSLDVFTSVTVVLEEPELPARTKNVIVSVVERKSQWLGWSAGFSTGEGVRGGFEYGYRNLFGAAVHASFRGQLGYQFVFLDKEIERRYTSLSLDQRLEYQATLTLGIPYVPHVPRTNLGVDLVALQDLQRDFRMQKEGVVGTVIYRPHKRWTLTFSEELEESDFFMFAPQQIKNMIGNLSPSDFVPEGANTLLSHLFAVSLDLRDRAYNPSKGLYISVNNEWATTVLENAGRVSTNVGTARVKFHSNMLRFLGNFAFYIPLFPKLIFASQWRYGRVVHLDKTSQSYPNRRFYLGGTNFRGFYQNQMIPQDLENAGLDASNIVSRGGETFLAGQNELRFPLFGDLYGGLFTDIGNLWAKAQNFDITELETVFGAGLRFQTPVASLAFDYGVRAVHANPFEMIGAFQFAFQTF
jgi:outer membrane protein assembly factor BamA